eukprot:GGOE01022420.1.p1 GENE.GGOE01022420.1~~GGOE01022420.1.p1  ORF type:complete len:352 (+),score=84.58 GGOE01022420.1:48-1058(+)
MTACAVPLEVRQLEGRGRGLFTTCDIAAGQSLGCHAPLVTAVAPGWRQFVCTSCLISSHPRRQPHTCAGCHVARFCSDDCRQAATHPPAACTAAHRLVKRLQQDDAMDSWAAAVAALMLQAFSTVDEELWSALSQLCALETANVEAELMVGLEYVAGVVEACLDPGAVARALEVSHFNSVADAAMFLLLRAECNSFSFWSSDGNYDQLGLGLFFDAAMYNHDCLPNVAKMVVGRNLQFIALRPIAKGSEVCISYVPVDEDRESRQHILARHFHFLCCCGRCTAEEVGRKEGDVVSVLEGRGLSVSCFAFHTSRSSKRVCVCVLSVVDCFPFHSPLG